MKSSVWKWNFKIAFLQKKVKKKDKKGNNQITYQNYWFEICLTVVQFVSNTFLEFTQSEKFINSDNRAHFLILVLHHLNFPILGLIYITYFTKIQKLTTWHNVLLLNCLFRSVTIFLADESQQENSVAICWSFVEVLKLQWIFRFHDV